MELDQIIPMNVTEILIKHSLKRKEEKKNPHKSRNAGCRRESERKIVLGSNWGIRRDEQGLPFAVLLPPADSYDPLPVACMHTQLLQLCLTFCKSVDCSPPDSFVLGIFQARILDWIAISFFKGSSDPGIKPRSPALQVVYCIAGRFFTA